MLSIFLAMSVFQAIWGDRNERLQQPLPETKMVRGLKKKLMRAEPLSLDLAAPAGVRLVLSLLEKLCYRGTSLPSALRDLPVELSQRTKPMQALA